MAVRLFCLLLPWCFWLKGNCEPFDNPNPLSTNVRLLVDGGIGEKPSRVVGIWIRRPNHYLILEQFRKCCVSYNNIKLSFSYRWLADTHIAWWNCLGNWTVHKASVLFNTGTFSRIFAFIQLCPTVSLFPQVPKLGDTWLRPQQSLCSSTMVRGMTLLVKIGIWRSVRSRRIRMNLRTTRFYFQRDIVVPQEIGI